MASAKIRLRCDVAIRDLLCVAIRDYAVAAYPTGGSDCAQVARYTLLELADQIEQGINDHAHELEISRRPRAMVRAALGYYFDRQDHASQAHSSRQRDLLTALLQEQPVSAADLAQARAADERS